ncbi:aldo/keto reductase [Candidatus Pelagibacter sp.]|nr:aldo/keto reductase [Candidatus Pelagibacter sp.]
MNLAKLAIGTAQLNNIYGYNNKRIKLNKKIFFEIVKLSQKNKINLYDTAEGYNNHRVLASILGKNDKIISKIIYDNKIDYQSEIINEKINKILEELNLKKIDGLLIHNTNYIRHNKFKKFFQNLKKKSDKIKKLGFSCYNISDIEYLVKNFKFQILQFPFNVFDQRLARETKIIQMLKSKKIEIHIRSIFLQGVLLNEDIKNHKYFKKWTKFFDKFELFKRSNKLNNIETCIFFLKQHNFYDRVVVGLDNINHFKELLSVLKSKNKKKKYNFKKFSTNEKKLILPNLWKI